MARDLVHIGGLTGVLETLKGLPREVVSKRGGPIRAALRKAAVVIQKQEILNLEQIIAQPNAEGVPNDSTGLLKKNVIVTRGKPPQGQNGERYLVRIRNKKYPDVKGKAVTTAQVGRLLEYGNETRPPMPFIRPAFEAKKGEALETFIKETHKSIRRIQRKLERQNRVKT